MNSALISALALLAVGRALPAGAQPERLRPERWEPPHYTEVGWRARIAGRVEIALTIDSTGAVTEATLMRRLPMGLDQAAVSAARMWRFAAAALPERRTTLSVDFAADPADAWDDGAAWLPDGTLRVWRVHPLHRLTRGLAEGASLALTSPDALAAIAAAIHSRAARLRTREILSIDGHRPDHAFMRNFKDLHGRVYRSRWAVNLGAEPINVRRAGLSPRGQVILEISSRTYGSEILDLYSVESRDGRWTVVEFNEPDRGIS